MLVPVALAIFCSRMDEVPMEVNYLVINLTLASVAAYIQCALIAEEKEKNTLRGLMLSPATIPEILSGKTLVTLLITIITILLCMTFTGYQPANMTLISAAVLLSAIFYVIFGTMLGMLIRSVVDASVLLLPIILVFGFGNMMTPMIEMYPFLSFLEYLPSFQLLELAVKVEEGKGFSGVYLEFLVIGVWFLLTVFLTVLVYKKREVDN
ncbi:ABC transporter permease [Virgibacillus sp. YIM 98842]|uniref:ABC transporter permease n=1 Tax=Virgibacillus sp. YIM 98842 TaxID=2663533 RepID=UPI0013D95B3B|nr:ABC transporter permease [Virgibacillus sp. YIM 98842]